MKKNNLYIVALTALAVGLLLGWMIFKDDRTISLENGELKKTEEKSEIWTCSMHPQIRQNEPGDCPICGMDLIPAGQADNSNSNGFQMTDDAIKLANIQTTIIGNNGSEVESVLKLNGKIQANETKSASIVSHIPGRIEKLYVSYTGEQVNKGQKIATVYSPDLITAQKELLEAKKIEEISPDLLQAAKNKLKYWKIDGQVIEEILQSGSVKENFTIYAEHSGIVERKKVSVGDYLTTGEVLFDVQNLNNLWVLFDVYENDLSKISIGSKIDFTTPSASNKVFEANITFIDPVINPQTRVSTVRAEVNNSGRKLKPEMFITGELSIMQKSNNLTVPKSAVLWTGKRSVVYVKEPNTEIPSFEFREIEIGDATQSGYEVITGLDKGEEVVSNGAFVIDASAQLNNRTSMMNRNVMLKNELHSNHLPDYTASTPNLFKEQLTALTNTYFPLKDALVESDVGKAAIATSELLNFTDNVDMSLVKGEAHSYWMEQLKAIKSHGKKIKKSEDIEEQRKQFVSKQEKILNPYFGEKMLKCGTIQDTIDENFKNSPMLEQSSNQIKLHNH